MPTPTRARWQARAEALAAALDAGPQPRRPSPALGDLPGVVGPLVDHLEIDAGAEAAVTAVLGDALQRDRRRRPGDGSSGARPASPTATPGRSCSSPGPRSGDRAPAPAALPGTRRLADCVRSSVPGRRRPRSRAMLDGALLAEGDWSSRARSRAARPAADRRDPRRATASAAGVRGGSAATRWRRRGRRSTRPRTGAPPRRSTRAERGRGRAGRGARPRSSRPRRADEAEAAEAERRARPRARRCRTGPRAGRRRTYAARGRGRGDRAPSGRRCTCSARDDVERVAALEVRVPALEAEAAEAQSLFESRALVQLELDERATTVASQRRELDLRAAQTAERRRVLEHRLAEVDDRLARDPERRAEAERHRRALEQRGTGYRVGRRAARRS